jgi:hypothetical protein
MLRRRIDGEVITGFSDYLVNRLLNQIITSFELRAIEFLLEAIEFILNLINGLK